MTLIVAVLAAVVISAFCSLSEAALYSVPWSWIERLRKDGRASGELLFSLRSNVEKPITAILTLNTIANTAGAAIAGAAGAAVFGAEDLWLFTAIFTVLILAFGEILPKTMAQRLSLARVFLTDSRLLLLDEPASGLDPASAAWLGREIRAAADAGTAVVWVSHHEGGRDQRRRRYQRQETRSRLFR